MRRMIPGLAALVLLASMCIPVHAAGNVTYSGDAGQFVFEPGSEFSPTDLFTDFKQVMPGDTLTQPVILRNNASDRVQVKIYLRALGVHDDQSDEVLLSQLTLSVKMGENELFHAPAHQTAQLTEWVALGTLESGGSAQLEVSLHVPTTLDSRFMDRAGSLDWQFTAEEIPVQKPDIPPDEPDVPPDEPDVPPDEPDKPDKPDVPKTGDEIPVDLFAGLFIGSGLLLAALLLLLLRNRRRSRDQGPS